MNWGSTEEENEGVGVGKLQQESLDEEVAALSRGSLGQRSGYATPQLHAEPDEIEDAAIAYQLKGGRGGCNEHTQAGSRQGSNHEHAAGEAGHADEGRAKSVIEGVSEGLEGAGAWAQYGQGRHGEKHQVEVHICSDTGDRDGCIVKSAYLFVKSKESNKTIRTGYRP